MLDEWMVNLAKEFEVEGSFATEIKGVWAIPLEEDLDVMISNLGQEGFSLSTKLIKRPENQEEAVYTHLMTGNLFGEGTKGGILGLDPDGKMLTLSQHIDYTVNYKEFVEILEDFLNSVDFWRDEVKSFT